MNRLQVVFLTATLGPGDVGLFYSRMKLDGQRVCFVRQPTTRRNITYRVKRVEEEEGEVQRVVEGGLERYPGGKIIVYSGQIKRAERLGELLLCPVYHSKVDTAEGKARRVAEWMEKGGVIVTTNALGMGIDIPNVRMVVHAGAPRRLRDYAQESGRAGRDGEKSEAVIIHRMQRRRGPKKETTGEEGWLEKGMEELVGGIICRRVVLDRMMDGCEDREGCLEGEEMCDVCEGGRVELEEAEGGLYGEVGVGVEDLEVYVQEEAEEEREEEKEEEREQVEVRAGNKTIGKEDGVWEFLQIRNQMVRESRQGAREIREAYNEVAQFQEQLESWVGCCVVCRFGGEEECYHKRDECPRRDSEGWVDMEDGIRIIGEELFGGRRMDRFSSCFSCGVPQALCIRWKEEEGDGGRFRQVPGGRCQYQGLLIPILVGSMVKYGEPAMRVVEQMMEKDGVDGRERVGWYKWFGKLISWGGIQASQVCRVCVYLGRLEKKR